MQPISIMRTFAAASHSSLQYLLSFVAGHPQVSRAHLFLFSSFAISINLLTKLYFFPFFLPFDCSGLALGGRPALPNESKDRSPPRTT